MTDEEAIFAYIDGEIDDAERIRIETKIAADPALQAIVSEHRALAARLNGAFATLLDDPVPPKLARTAMGGAEVIDLADARARRKPRARAGPVVQWAALAATLVAGLVGGAVLQSGPVGPVTEQGGQLIASGKLALALDTQLASTQTATDAVRIEVTFRNHNGAICRSFTARATEGVACHDGHDWQLRGLLAHDKANTGDYRMASSSGAAELVDALIAGEALDQAQERAALAAHWTEPGKP
ncbi:MAG: anti-sigma factor [Pseudomonadota bacterium]|nr:anti-sigma factor [Pseudomonadota bacterium]